MLNMIRKVTFHTIGILLAFALLSYGVPEALHFVNTHTLKIEKQWSDNDWRKQFYQNCVLPHETVRVLVEENPEGEQRITYYDFNNKPHPATYELGALGSNHYKAKLDNGASAYLSMGPYVHKRHCHLFILNKEANTSYQKDGQWDFSTDWERLSDL